MPAPRFRPKPPKPAVLDEFADWLNEERGLSANTAKSYASDLHAFLRYCQNIRADADGADKKLLRQWLRHRAQSVGPKTRARNIATLRAYFDFLDVEHNPAVSIRPPKLPPYQPPYVARSTVAAIIDQSAHLAEAPLLNLRNQALFCFIYATGGRITEILARWTKDLQPDDYGVTWLHFERTKNLGSYDVPIPPVALDLLHAYHAATDNPWTNKPLFMRNLRTESPLHAGQVRKLFHDAEARLDVGRIHPHLFRHALAHHLLETGVDNRLVQAFLGHRDPGSTAHYTQNLRHMMRDVMLRRHPLQPEEAPPVSAGTYTAVERHRGDVPAIHAQPRTVSGQLLHQIGDVWLSRNL